MKHGAIRWIVAGLVFVCWYVTTPCSLAGNNNAGRKLGRGVANTLLGIVEIPDQIVQVSREHGGGAGATWGVIKGIGRFFEREGVGIYEIITFPIPAPRGYEPIMQPEFLLGQDKGEY